VLFDQSAGGFISYLCDTVISNTVTYHVVFVYSPSKGCNIYINGVSQPLSINPTGSYVAMENFSNNIRIGGATFSDQQTLLGKLDGLGIWDVELNYRQVKSIYDKQASGLEIL